MVHPARRQSRDSRSKWRDVDRFSGLFLRDAAAPNLVVAWELIDTAIEADVLDRQLGSGATDVE